MNATVSTQEERTTSVFISHNEYHNVRLIAWKDSVKINAIHEIHGVNLTAPIVFLVKYGFLNNF